jgi:patatin-like phospholipase/acyl hydrolase
VLRQLEVEAGVAIGQCFDLIAGTSVGGIIALGLAAHRPAAEIERAFLANGGRIFSTVQPAAREAARRRAFYWKLLRHLRQPFYGKGPLLDTIRAILPEGTTVGELRTRTIVPAVNLSKGAPQVFKTPHHASFRRDWRLPIEDIALATSAAPGYFAPHRIGSELFADGGLYANSPDLLALHEASHFLGRAPDAIRVLSIGTTITSIAWSNAVRPTLGWFDWLLDERVIRAMMAAQQLNTGFILGHQLGERYVRIDRVPSTEQALQIGLDVASDVAKQDLLALAEASAREAVARPIVREMLRHRAPAPDFPGRDG